MDKGIKKFLAVVAGYEQKKLLLIMCMYHNVASISLLPLQISFLGFNNLTSSFGFDLGFWNAHHQCKLNSLCMVVHHFQLTTG